MRLSSLYYANFCKRDAASPAEVFYLPQAHVDILQNSFLQNDILLLLVTLSKEKCPVRT